MGGDRLRHFRDKPSGYYWEPSATLKALGMEAESLGTEYAKAGARAIELNNFADDLRNDARSGGGNGPRPGTVSRLFRDYQASEEFAALKPRTRKDYAYYLINIEAEFGQLPVLALTARVLKAYYKRLRAARGISWAYHVIGTLRAALTWGVGEDWIADNPALKFEIENPKKRTVKWSAEETATYIAAARAHRPSLVALALVFDCIGQSPIDLRQLKRRDYRKETRVDPETGIAASIGLIDVTREKTGVGDAPIPLFPEATAALDEYLATRPSLHPDAPLFVNDNTHEAWGEQALMKAHRAVRKAAGLRRELQLQDFRRTAATEAAAGSATVDELRALQRHSTRTAALHYVHPDGRFVDTAQAKRLAVRKANARSGSGT